MSVESALRAGRAAAERRMTDRCRITRPGDGRGPWNPTTGDYDPPPPVTVYEGRCRLNVPSVSPQTANAAESSWTVQDSVLSLPVAASEAVAVDQTVEYLSAPHDPSLAGRRFGIIGQHSESQATARRLKVREVTG